MKEHFMKTTRIGFSNWTDPDLKFARQLWGEKEVTQFICATGVFTLQDICNQLDIEIRNGKEFHVQYWPIFEIETGELIGCCGLRPFKSEQRSYEIGFYLRKIYWGKGYAFEAANAVMDYSFTKLNADELYAGHHPQNVASKKLLTRLGFQYIGDNYYKPTRLYHPSYKMTSQDYKHHTPLGVT